MKVKPKESFQGCLNSEYPFSFNEERVYECRCENGVYYINSEESIPDIPFDKEDFNITFDIIDNLDIRSAKEFVLLDKDGNAVTDKNGDTVDLYLE